MFSFTSFGSQTVLLLSILWFPQDLWPRASLLLVRAQNSLFWGDPRPGVPTWACSHGHAPLCHGLETALVAFSCTCLEPRTKCKLFKGTSVLQGLLTASWAGSGCMHGPFSWLDWWMGAQGKSRGEGMLMPHNQPAWLEFPPRWGGAQARGTVAVTNAPCLCPCVRFDVNLEPMLLS